MGTVACPGCGLPRTGAEIGTKPCPVCAATPSVPSAPKARKPAAPDPTAGLPADASELYAPGAPVPPRAAQRTSRSGSRVRLVGAGTFLLGALCGGGGVLAVQALDRVKPQADEPRVAAPPEGTNAPSAITVAPRALVVAPMPHETRVRTGPGESAPAPTPVPEPDFKIVPLPPPGRLITVELDQPEGDYHLPFPMLKGEHIVLKGRVKKLHVTGLDAGSILDASGLEASVITVTGKIDGHSTLKLNAPNGTVHVSAQVDGRSVVAIDAPGGEVRFLLATNPMREGSKIDGGSTVSVAARRVELRGDITGAETRVAVALGRGGGLDIEAVRGRAVVEYKSSVAGWAAPTVRIGSVAATAAVRKVE